MISANGSTARADMTSFMNVICLAIHNNCEHMYMRSCRVMWCHLDDEKHVTLLGEGLGQYVSRSPQEDDRQALEDGRREIDSDHPPLVA
jgi:hypothetical protein